MINKIIEIVREASKLMTADIIIEQKGNDSNYVTSADVNVQHYLEQHLPKLIPGSTFLGEEEEEEVIESEYIWVVDPIDGTSNFIRGLGASAISVGLVKDEKPYLGVIYEPYGDEMYWAERGKGAFLNGKPIHVSDRDFKHATLCSAASLYNKDLAKPCFNIIEKVYFESDDFRRFGSAAIELAYLAAGRVELYFEIRLFPWDIAAGLVIIEEAGGFVEVLHEETFPLDRPAGVIAANNRENFDKLREIVYEEIPEKMY
ncbi:MAG: inositol monophosphatase [Tyzzerella sp.]|nr:inositol monophosphatase [Tyzzerella sp.]